MAVKIILTDTLWYLGKPKGVVIIQPRVGVATPTLGIRLREHNPVRVVAGRIQA
jgi:hypothetical protein